MNKKIIAILTSLIISFSFALSPLATAATVFSDYFSTGNFANWSKACVSSDSSQIVSNGIARFIVPTPTSGTYTYSYVQKDGFTSTVNSIITATQDVYVTKVPNSCPQGNGAIFFLYICDSSDLSGNNGNFGVGIDGSDVWSLWIGGNTIYSYVFQSAGSPPVSNTWYHTVLTINNPEGTVTLTVDGTTVINVGQQQLTDETHPISLMSGMGEDWWSGGSGQQEVEVANVQLDISDANPMPTPNPTSMPPSTPTSTPIQNLTPTSTHNGTITPAPSATTKPSPSPTPDLSPTPSPTSATIQATQSEFPLWIVLLLIMAMVVCVALVIMLRKHK